MQMIRLAAALALAAVFSMPAAAQIVVGGESMQMLPPPGGRPLRFAALAVTPPELPAISEPYRGATA